MKNIKKFNRLIQLLRIKPEFSKEITSYRKNNKWCIGVTISASSILKGNKHSQEYMITEILHEIGHFLVAPPGRRFKKDFGIRLYKRNDQHWEDDDKKASIVENDFRKYFGISPILNTRILFNKYPEYKIWYNSEGHKLAKQLLDLVP